MRSEASRAKCVPKWELGNENYVPGRTRVKAYYGMMTAMTNYFGKAFSVKGAQGEELLRFVENGNVLLMKENLSIDRSVHQMANFTTLGLPASGGKQFIVRNTDGTIGAVLKPYGQLYLAGVVYEEIPQDDMTPAAGEAAFKIMASDGVHIACTIDTHGDLKMTGHLYVEGLPWSLSRFEDGHALSTAPSDPYFSF